MQTHTTARNQGFVASLIEKPGFSAVLITLTILLVGALMAAPGIAAPLAQQDTPTPKWPTDTPIPPTDTPLPTDTPIPPTDTPLPTDTPIPTDTPLPTAIPPTSRPKPKSTAIPVPTPTPVPVLLPETGGGATGIAMPFLLVVVIGLISCIVWKKSVE